MIFAVGSDTSICLIGHRVLIGNRSRWPSSKVSSLPNLTLPYFYLNYVSCHRNCLI